MDCPVQAAAPSGYNRGIMSSPASLSGQNTRVSPLKLIAWVVLVAILLAALLAAGALVWFRAAVQAAMPKLDGTVVVRALGSRVGAARHAWRA